MEVIDCLIVFGPLLVLALGLGIAMSIQHFIDISEV